MARPIAYLSIMSGVALMSGVTFTSCAEDSGATGDSGMCPAPTVTKAPANEWVGFHTELPIEASAFHAFASGLFGTDAQAGKFAPEKELTPGVFLTASAEPSTPDQTRLTFAFDDGNTTPRRVLAVAPASFKIGAVFIAAVEAALAKMQADVAADPNGGEAFYLEYRVASAQGGRLSFGVRGEKGIFKVVVDITGPHTGLEKSKIGKASDDFEPYDTVAGTVWFHMQKSEFDFFSSHAYGSGATSKQNFTDFKLVPHEWLRLTVEPHLEEQFVSVGFEVVTTDGKRVPVAKAPASILAGDTFRALVDRYMTTMTDQEKNVPGSSTPFQVPFYYDNPDGGGVVQVIVQGNAGQFSVAYAIESPRNTLKDVPFVPYQAVTIEPPDPNAEASCDMLGDPSIKPAPKGTLDITFQASDTIKKSPELMGPLVGNIYCSLFHKEDVEITGPVKGAVAIQDFVLEKADLSTGPAPTFVTQELFAGEYQVLCAQDLDGDGEASHGDPVTLPIGGYTVACNKNPVTVEFAILNPQ
ncbi:Hypothetical protein A7982_03201 [Minicystis rosea]|nr:Hypothetical protein A7982_03201 [Minicystis rosea]